MPDPIWTPTTMLAEVRRQVRDVLTSSPAYRSLDAGRQRQIAADMVSVAAYLANPDGALTADFARTGRARIPQEIRPVDPLAGEVDFPGFVAGLIGGVFQAIVDSSVRQMEAYGDLVAGVVKTIAEFSDDDDDDTGSDNARDKLAFAASGPAGPSTEGPAHRQRALARQLHLITTLKMGINRIVVTDG